MKTVHPKFKCRGYRKSEKWFKTCSNKLTEHRKNLDGTYTKQKQQIVKKTFTNFDLKTIASLFVFFGVNAIFCDTRVFLLILD